MKTDMKTNLFILLALFFIFTGCEDLLSPADENNPTLENIYEDAAYAEGLLLNAYVFLPSGSYSFNDVATDDAVSNDPNNNYLAMATGGWSAMENPTSRWVNSYAAINYLNIFLAETDQVEWATTGEYVKEMFNDRFKGEAYGLRALFMYYLLEAHAGKDAGGNLLGVPILTEPLDGQSSYDIPRSTFEQCITQVYEDLTKAESYLPLDFEDIQEGELPSKYQGKTSVSDYNRVFGAYNRQRLSTRIVKGIRAKVALLAASPAFNETTSWENAADAAGQVLDLIGGVAGIDPQGGTWYSKENGSTTDNLVVGTNPQEILWRTNVSEESDLEPDNYPPSLYGSGRVNPTQNLVDAFPMANGLPIADGASGYDENNPYVGRDPRLNDYILYNGSVFGPGSNSILTSEDSGEDGIGAIAKSTRTGYYLRKLLREDVNLDAANKANKKHYVSRIRYTELFLAYAEAANEAWGPDGSGSHGYSARDVIAAIRQRAGISQPDNYLASISSLADMRKLIRNERRLELCFEGNRFWDLRRWNESLSETARGMRISSNGAYQVVNIEKRQYQDYMNYGPLPYQEVIKWNMTQNVGW